MPICTAKLRTKDNEIHTTEVEASSLFDAAAKAMHQCYMCWWFDGDAPVTITLGEKSWTVRPHRVSEWQKEKWKTPHQP